MGVGGEACKLGGAGPSASCCESLDGRAALEQPGNHVSETRKALRQGWAALGWLYWAQMGQGGYVVRIRLHGACEIDFDN